MIIKMDGIIICQLTFPLENYNYLQEHWRYKYSLFMNYVNHKKHKSTKNFLCKPLQVRTSSTKLQFILDSNLKTWDFKWKLWFGSLSFSLGDPSGCYIIAVDLAMWLQLAVDSPQKSFKSMLFEHGHPHCYVELHARNICYPVESRHKNYFSLKTNMDV